MGISPSGSSHHRRRSSVLTGAGGASQYRPVNAEPQEESPRFAHGEADGSKLEEQKPLNGDRRDSSDLSSIAESEELSLSDDEHEDDEETGLTAKERSHRRQKRRKLRRQLDARIAGVKASKRDGSSLADKNVIRRLLINAGLILLWYLFSLSISVVRTPDFLRALFFSFFFCFAGISN
jgi:solute carrier family 35 protein C2